MQVTVGFAMRYLSAIRSPHPDPACSRSAQCTNRSDLQILLHPQYVGFTVVGEDLLLVIRGNADEKPSMIIYRHEADVATIDTVENDMPLVNAKHNQ